MIVKVNILKNTQLRIRTFQYLIKKIKIFAKICNKVESLITHIFNKN